MKYIVLFFFLLFSNLNNSQNYKSVRFAEDNSLLAIKDVAVKDILNSSPPSNYEPINSEEELKAEEASVNFMSSWKFYFILLIFPVMLLLIFLMISRGKK